MDWSKEELEDEVLPSLASHVVLTGGEPTLQPISTLAFGTKAVAVETNGTHPDELARCKENGWWITFSPKQIVGWEEVYKRTWPLADEIKVVYGAAREDLLVRCLEEHARRGVPIFLQPLERGKKYNVQEALGYIAEHPAWRLSFQTHKLLGLR